MNTISKQSVANALRLLVYFYLLLPHFIYFLGWIKPLIGIPVAVLLGISFYKIIRQNFQYQYFSNDEKIGWKPIILLVVIAFLLTLWSGAGGYFFQRSDYIKINAIFRVLIEQDWAVTFTSLKGIDEPTHFNYYMAYLLPVAFLGKILGIQHADQIALFWTFLGYAFAMLWFVLLNRKSIWIPVAVFFLFNGLEPLLIAGNVVFKIILGESDKAFLYHTIRTGWDVLLADGVFRYNGNYIALTWVPHHALGMWLSMSVFVYETIENKRLDTVALLIAVMLLWSPFPSVSLAILAGFYIVQYRFQTVWTYHNLVVAPILVIIFGLMYQAHYPLLAEHAGNWTWHFLPFPKYIFIYFIFILIKFVGYSACIHPFVVNSPHRKLWYLMMIALVLIPHYRIGSNNDSLANLYAPFMFLLTWLIAKYLSEKSLWKNIRIRLLAVLLLLGGVEAVRTVLISWFRPVLEPTFTTSIPIAESLTFQELHQRFEVWFVRHYIGKNDSFYARYLLKK